MNYVNILLYFSYFLMTIYYIILISRLYGNNNLQNRFIRFSLKNIYDNNKRKIKNKINKLNNYKFLFNLFYTTKTNNNIDYDELRNFILIFMKNNKNTTINEDLIKDKIIKNYLN